MHRKIFKLIKLKDLGPFFDYKHRIIWSKVENVKNVKYIQHNVVREMIKYFQIKNILTEHKRFHTQAI